MNYVEFHNETGDEIAIKKCAKGSAGKNNGSY